MRCRRRWCVLTRWICHKKSILFAVILLLFWSIPRFERTPDRPVIRQQKYPRVAVGISGECLQMTGLIQASKDTWVKQLSYDIFYFVGRPSFQNTPCTNETNLVVLPYKDEEYPPVNKTFAMWNYFYTNQSMNYDFFVAVDSDTYVNVPILEGAIERLTCRDCYYGYASSGGEYRVRLDLHVPYCLGMGYVISRSALLKFGPHINTCQTSIAARHSDTEIGRCVQRFAGNLSCTSAGALWRMVITTTNEKNEKLKPKFNKRGQIYVNFPEGPPTYAFRTAMMHPLKEPRHFHLFHQQVVFGLRPVLAPIYATYSCVANPVLQKEIHPDGPRIPECPTSKSNISLDVKALKTFVLTLPDREDRVSDLINAFRKHDIRVERFNVRDSSVPFMLTNLTIEQKRLRLTMMQFFHMARMRNLQQVLVLEDDTIPHVQLRSRLRALLSGSRCGGYMHNTQGAGILMLGATVWQDGWEILDKLAKNETGSCRNICSKIRGSFAVLYHKITFTAILTWLNNNTNEPYDSVFPHLSRLGYPVRLAVPNLVIRNTTHASPFDRSYNDTVHYDLTMRASVHRWKLSDYMFT